MKKIALKVAAFLIALAVLGASFVLPNVRSAQARVKPMVAGGCYHSLALKSDGTVWAWGQNTYGQLGDGTTTNRLTPAQVQGLSDVVAVSAGGFHSLALKSDGTVWAWGHNNNSQLGDGTTTNRSTPVQVQGLTGVVAIAAGEYHSLALKFDGTVWAWGSNGNYQLGDGTSTFRSTPVQVQGLTGVVAIAAGGSHSLALKSDGTVWAWGYNYYGQLGDNTTTNRSTPVKVQNLSGVVAAIAAGGNNSLVLKSDGTVWAWGRIFLGQTAVTYVPVQAQNLSGVVAVAAGGNHFLNLKSDGTVWAWGSNNLGQLGDGTTTSTEKTDPVQVKGPGGSGYLTDVVAIVAGDCYYQSFAIKSDGTVWAWGANNYGQLGDGTMTNSNTPVQVQNLNLAASPINPESITANPDSVNLLTGQTQQLTVTAQMPDGSTLDVTNQASYQSDNSSIAQVSASGLVTAVASGTANITVTYQGKTATVPVTVREVTAITVSPDSLNLLVGQTQQLTVTAQMSDGSSQDVTAQASYTSSNSSIASVSQGGLVTANSAGVATITVSYQGKTATVSVMSALPVAVVDYLTVTPSSVSLLVGDSQPLAVMAHYSDGSTKDVTDSASYQVSDPSVADVSGGQITAVNGGSTIVTASYGGKTVSVPVTVAGGENNPPEPNTGPQIVSPPPRPGAPTGEARPESNPVVIAAPKRPGAPTIGPRPVSEPVAVPVERPTETSVSVVTQPPRQLGNTVVVPPPARPQWSGYTVISKKR